ncbi:MAG: hypothetical protein IJ236_00390 [Oscillospiraceae bacterium]|nr:hypothetical protein [Oscillospiraceae bacterium]
MWLLSAIISLFTTNLIFTRALGTSTVLAASRNRSNLPVLALLMTVFSSLGCLLTCIVFHLFKLQSLVEYPYSLGLPLVYTVIISIIYCLILVLLFFVMPDRFSGYKKYVHLSAFNCAVMGTLYLAFEPMELLENAWFYSDRFVFGSVYADRFTVAGALLFGLQEGLGFLLAALILSAVRERLYDPEVPAVFRGFPAAMIYIGLISMAIYAITVN